MYSTLDVDLNIKTNNDHQVSLCPTVDPSSQRATKYQP